VRPGHPTGLVVVVVALLVGRVVVVLTVLWVLLARGMP
jgi:hypothetical protein